MGARAIAVKGPVTWNALPKVIKDSGSIKTFQSKLKKYFLENKINITYSL